MKLYNCCSELEKKFQEIDLASLKPEEKGMLAIEISKAFFDCELKDEFITISALKQIALSLISIPASIETIQYRDILLAYPVDDKEIVLAHWGHEYVTWQFRRENEEFSFGHYFYYDCYESSVEAYLSALKDFKQRIYDFGVVA